MATPIVEAGAAAELELDPAEQEVLLVEVAAFAEALQDAESRRRYGLLAAAARGGTIPGELVAPLETMLELLLQSPRVRRQHGPEGEQALTRLLQRTPRGAALKQAAREVNEALSVLRGLTLEGISFTATPRGHTLAIETDRCHVTLAIDRAGVHVERVEIGL